MKNFMKILQWVALTFLVTGSLFFALWWRNGFYYLAWAYIVCPLYLLVYFIFEKGGQLVEWLQEHPIKIPDFEEKKMEKKVRKMSKKELKEELRIAKKKDPKYAGIIVKELKRRVEDEKFEGVLNEDYELSIEELKEELRKAEKSGNTARVAELQKELDERKKFDEEFAKQYGPV